MDYRGNRLLKLMLKEESIHMKELSKLFVVSEKVIRSLLKELNHELIEKGLPGFVIDASGTVLFTSLPDQGKRDIKKFILESNFYTYRLTPSERKTISAMILMNGKGYRTAAQLSEYLEISRNTIIGDFNQLKNWFLENHMVLVSQVQKGYKIQGAERDIRKGIRKLIELNLDYQNYENGENLNVFQHLLLRELQYEQRTETIRSIVKKEEVRHNIYFSDYSFQQVVSELLILIKRLMLGMNLPDDIDDGIKKSSKYPISRDILEHLEGIFGVQIPEIEKKNFVNTLRKKSFLKSSTKNIDKLVVPVMVGEAIHHIAGRLHIKFHLDFELYDVLVDHMKSMLFRAQFGESLRNPLEHELEKNYSEIFHVVNECLKPLEAYAGKKIGKDEVSFLVMYFASMVERDQLEQSKKEKVSVILVGSMGRGTMRYMMTELKRFDDILEIIGIRSSHEVADLDHEQVEMVISTVPLKNICITTVQVESPILNKEDSYKIWMTAMEILEYKQKKKTYLKSGEELDLPILKHVGSSFLSVNRIFLDADADSWEEAIRISGNLLYETGMVKQEYIEAMIENVKTNGTYIVICPGLAIPHAEADKGTIREAASFVRLKTPIAFGNMKNDPVSYVVGLSILGADSINTLIYNLVKIFCDPQILLKMNAASSNEEMYQLLKDKL